MNKFIKITIIIIAITLGIYGIYKIYNIEYIVQTKRYPKKYSQYVAKYAKEYNVDELLIYSIIKAESNFKLNSNSSANAIGLMQIMQDTANEIGSEIEETITLTKLYEPETNIKFGCYYFSKLLKKYNNIGVALAAYNAGMGRVDEWIANKIINPDGTNLENIPYKETNLYVRKVINNYNNYKKIY